MRAERAEPVSSLRVRAKGVEGSEEAPEQRPGRSEQLREEERRASQQAEGMLSHAAAELRAAAAKARVAREARASQLISDEQALQAAALQRRQAERERTKAAASSEQELAARKPEAKTRQEREQQLRAVALQVKEQREWAAAARSDEEARLVRRKNAIKKEKAAVRPAEAERPRREPIAAVQKPMQVELPTPKVEERRSSRFDTNRKRAEDEARAAEATQITTERERQRSMDRERAEAVAAMRPNDRRERKREVAVQSKLESQIVESPPPLEKRESERKWLKRRESAPAGSEPSLRDEKQRQRRSPGLSLVPGAIGGGSTARAVSVTESAADSVHAAADSIPYLLTRGSLIIDENGDAITLRGVTVRGLDNVTSAVTNALSLDAAGLATITGSWGANLVRIPFARNTILNGNGAVGASDLLAQLDDAVTAITEAGAFVLLALEAAEGVGPIDPGTFQVWETLATRYQNEPRVFYEVFASANPIGGDLNTQFATLIDTIRQQDPTALVFVPGGASGLDVSGVPLRGTSGTPLANLVYTIRVSVQSVPITEVLSAVAAAYPIFASWSDDGSDLGRQASRVADLFERCGIGWAAANWNSEPRLVINAGEGDFTPTIWGNVVLRAVKLTKPPLLETADAAASLSTLRVEFAKPLRLGTSGNFIVDDDGNAIALRGITVTGLDGVAPASGQTVPDALSIDENNLAVITTNWGLNLIRLPFSAQTVITGNGTVPAGRILAGLDLTATLIARAGAYVLLALEAAPGVGLPDASTQQALQLLARRYKDEPGVLYEIFASPEPLGAGWLQAALNLIGTIRSQNSAAMIFVNAGNVGNLTGMPLLLPTGDRIYNVVYTVNVSPQNSPGPDDGQLASFADLNPVFVSTWSDDATNPSLISPYVGDFFSRHNMGFAAANWNADPRLVTDALNHDFTSTPWGLIVGRAARLPVRQMLKPF